MTPRPNRVLVTGAAGFLGTWLCHRLVEEGACVAGLVRRPPDAESLFARLGLLERVELWPGADSLCDRLKAFEPGIVVNLAGSSQAGAARTEPARAFHQNTGFLWGLLDDVRRAERRIAVIHASTEAVYGAREGGRLLRESDRTAALAPYAASKAAAEIVLRSFGETYGIPTVIVRFGNIYGPGDPNSARLIPDLMQAFEADRSPRLRDGQSVRSYLYVDDAVDAILLLASHMGDEDVRGEVFNVAGDQPYTTLSVATLVRDAVGRSDIQIIVGESPDSSVQFASTDKIKQTLGWAPRISLADGLRQIAREEVRR
ncbi:NAD-dependent epimerase/dehydratase family protein [Methylobacterium planeticum]|uniref:NAD-dependent epimerase/dehydratase family protein n=1 Tax=Methylobacterium planeticum TaxID=2615211 RepID=UPI00177B7A5F|nr:NAD(P)-dependent oxidoreductase [Methylobacterium planeticum]